METIKHENYVSLDVAKQLKEIGFDWSCRGYYDRRILRFNFVWDYNGKGTLTQCCAPTLDVAQKWFIEVKKMCLVVFPVENRFAFIVVNLGEKFDLDDHILEYYTYEEAQEEGNKWMLELISDKEE